MRAKKIVSLNKLYVLTVNFKRTPSLLHVLNTSYTGMTFLTSIYSPVAIVCI